MHLWVKGLAVKADDLFHPQKPSDRMKELTPISYPLTSIQSLWLAYMTKCNKNIVLKKKVYSQHTMFKAVASIV